MNISVRGLDPGVVSTIDEFAKSNRESRNEYVKKILKWEAERNMMESARIREDEKMKSIYQTNEILLRRVEEMEFKLHQILALIIYNSDLESEELDHILNSEVVKGEKNL